MEKQKGICKDELFFFVYFSNFFIGIMILSCKYQFDSISSFFIFASLMPIPFILLCLVFFDCIYYFLKIVFKKHVMRNFIKRKN